LIKPWFTQLTSREHLILLIGSLILVGSLGYFGGWEPFVQAYTQLENRVIAQQTTLNWMVSAAHEVQQLRSAPVPPSSAPLLIVIDKSIHQGKARMEPKGEEQVAVSFEEIRFTELMRWLEILYNQQGIQVSQLSLEARPQPDKVTAQMILTRTVINGQ